MIVYVLEVIFIKITEISERGAFLFKIPLDKHRKPSIILGK